MMSLPQLPCIGTCASCNRAISYRDLETFIKIRDRFNHDARTAIHEFGIPTTVPHGTVGNAEDRYKSGTGSAFALDCIGMTKMCCRNVILAYFP